MFSHVHAIAQEAVADLEASSGDFLPELNVQSDCAGDPRLAGLLWHPMFGRGGDFDRSLVERSEELKGEIFANRIDIIAPLYVTSICSEQCLYCNFRAGNHGVDIERVRLSDDELLAEADYLTCRKGIRAVELVYASDPRMGADVIAHHVELLRNRLDATGGGVIGVNAEPFEESDYRSWRDAGVDFVALWQETYDAERYAQVHPGARKKRFEYRMDAYERMIAGGIRQIGMGVLSGLSDWRRDWAMLMHHEAYLRQSHGVQVEILGIPRLKLAQGAVLRDTPFVPSAEELQACVALHNIFSPHTRPFVSTRERWELCVELARGGGSLFTLNCSTTPGGYALGRGGAQFHAASYDAPAAARQLRRAGFSPAFSWPQAARPSAA